MPEASAHALPFVTRQGTKFGKLTPRDRAGILQRLKDQRKTKLREHLKDAGLPGDQVYVELEAFEDRVWGQREWIDFVNSADGPAELVALAYRKQNPAGDAAPVVDALEVADELFVLAAELCNLTLKPAGEKPAADAGQGAGAGQGTDQPSEGATQNPPAPATV